MMQIVVGAGRKPDPNGWRCTEQGELDLLCPADWERMFGGPGVLQTILVEAVWEHLPAEQALIAAQTCYTYLRPGGYVRAGVPDGLHPDPAYIELVRPGGTGSGALDHKVLYTHPTFSAVFTAAGFTVRLLEWWDEQGQFHALPWDPATGFVERSLRFDPRNTDGQPHYTLLILDAVKETN